MEEDEAPEAAPRPEREAEAADAPDPDDAFGNFARDGVAALERFGAELDAMFGVAPAPSGTTPQTSGASPMRAC